MAIGRKQYPFDLIEPKWQAFWETQETFRAWNPGETLPAGHPFAARHKPGGGKASAAELPPKHYILDMFPYPSGAGLHVGHPEGYTATDILSRYRRAAGYNVLHPMGWDAFGLPAEQYAIKTGQHPRKTTEANIATFKRQIKSLGFSYDWSREVDTTDPAYFKWTQWIFLKLYNSYYDFELNRAQPIGLLEDALSEIPKRETEWKDNPYLAGTRNGLFKNTTPEERGSIRKEFIPRRRLAYVTEAPVWWCEQLGTVLANEEVVDGKSEVGGFPVVRKPMRQWMLRITAYAERLLNDLESIDWSHSLKEMQRNWIGRSEGAEVDFQIAGSDEKIRVFTTRPDTLFGATYMVLSPEHALVDAIIPRDWPSSIPHSWKGMETESTVRSIPASVVSAHFGAEIISLTKISIPESVRSLIPKRVAIQCRAIPVAVRGNTVTVAVSDPANLEHLDLLHSVLNSDIELKTASAAEIAEVLDRYYNNPSEAILRYREYAASRSDLERTDLAKEKSGVFTGAYARNPVNGEKIPIWIADYVLASYGTGAIMAVPGHDTRDLEFASKFNLPILQVVQPPDPKTDWRGFVDDGVSVNSGFITGLPTPEAKKKIIGWLEEKGLGKRTINYKLRDWLFSRQRYWGEPFPIVWKKAGEGSLYPEALPESALPVLPPVLEDYKPTPDGQPPLARAKDWVNLPDGSVRETNTMPQWAGSCWYYLRYLDASNSNAFVGGDAEKYWMGTLPSPKFQVSSPKSGSEGLRPLQTPGVDLYVGGTEHAVLHLLYARFWHKVLFDLGHVSTPEPFFKLVNQGLILGEDNQKMSKSRGNVMNPDDILSEYGADAFRLYEMFMGPLEMVKPWNTKGVEGVYRFLGKVWRLFTDERSVTEFEQAVTTSEPAKRGALLEVIKLNPAIQDAGPSPDQLKALHACIKKVTEDLDGLRFNTAISALMVFINEAMTWQVKPRELLRDFLILLQPFAPHIAEELWEKMSQVRSPKSQVGDSLSYQPWPKYDAALLVENVLEIPVQVNGKLRDVIKMAAESSQAEMEAAALASEKVKLFIEGKTIKKIIVVPKKLVNIAVG